MTEKELEQIRDQARDTYRVRTRIPGYKTDQELKKPQPPLAKAPMTDHAIALPVNYEDLEIDNDFLHVINSRESHRVYTQERMNLLQLSYLLWCTQGVKSIRGKSYATLRTVPCGGARHPFECYMAVQMVDGLEDGLYHYLPLKHQIEYLGNVEDLRTFIGDSLVGQVWGAKANVVFYYSMVFYRAEWRYGVTASPISRTDAGHVTENLYLAATSIGLGGCAVGAIDPQICNSAFGVDGVEEFIFYAMPVGTISPKDKDADDYFYAFVKEEGL
ncbi:MAG: SagB/ThcOx family dehydrogenase [Solobacterium sp.]|nr:SagB/ThcOx family dehydrogenase [Solobacterium sp.]